MQEPATAQMREAGDRRLEETEAAVQALANQVHALLRQLRGVLPEERHRELSDRVERLQRPRLLEAVAITRPWKEEKNWLDETLALLLGLASEQAYQSRPRP